MVNHSDICSGKGTIKTLSVHEYASAAGFFSSASAFDKGEGIAVVSYLTLLDLRKGEETQAAIQVMRDVVVNSPNATAETTALFDEQNWRPHIAGCIALLLDTANEETISALCKALTKGSYAAPQIAVTAFFCDPYFENEAREYIELWKIMSSEFSQKRKATGSRHLFQFLLVYIG